MNAWAKNRHVQFIESRATPKVRIARIDREIKPLLVVCGAPTILSGRRPPTMESSRVHHEHPESEISPGWSAMKPATPLDFRTEHIRVNFFTR